MSARFGEAGRSPARRRAALLASGLLGAALPSPAAAVSLDLAGSNLNGNAVIDHSGPGLLSFDVDLQNAAVVTLKVDFDPGESAAAWNVLVTDLSGTLSGARVLSWSGAAITGQGTLRDGFDREVADVVLTGGSQVAVIDFADPGEAAGFTLGDPQGLIAGAADWGVEAPSNGASVTLVLPEPQAAWPRAAGLAALAALAARRRRGGCFSQLLAPSAR